MKKNRIKTLKVKYDKLLKKYWSKEYDCLDFGDDDGNSERARKFWLLESKIDTLEEVVLLINDFKLKQLKESKNYGWTLRIEELLNKLMQEFI